MSIGSVQAGMGVSPRTKAQVSDIDVSTLWDPVGAIADIILVHGLQGGPRTTWTFQVPDAAKDSNIFSYIRRASSSSKSATPATVTSACYWPEHLLPNDIKNCRIATYGYDSRINDCFGGAANQANIIGHGRSLLESMINFKRTCPARPTIFVAHRLGRLILKEALISAKHAPDSEPDLQSLVKTLSGIVFMGVPHRGAGDNFVDWGLMMQKIAVGSGFDGNDRVLRDLKSNSAMLEKLRTDFAYMLREGTFNVFTFQEGKGFAATTF
ncbi:hypothetical protein EJ08DRAFT_257770 [Tothia fuscella]|uniref:DUF676 domain-containing protein n=1 Tax=Tothia fuscella TaxID=1048955 RepID=A0A9P4TYL8_9PEZI|nr:hypothetical protein EJ08DRAFT_257770 [Tothia fuscella]